MAQLNVKVTAEKLAALRTYAARRRAPVTWLVKDYIDYLLAGGEPVTPPNLEDNPKTHEFTALAQAGGAFDHWLDEPDIYTLDDGEPGMKVGVRELKERTSEILRRVREDGEIVDVTYRGAIIARLVPPEATDREVSLAKFWENWDRVTEAVSAAWPAGVSAVDAIRADRRE